MSTLTITLAIVAALIGGYALGRIQSEITHLHQRIATLEKATKKHLPYRTAEEIENATAALNSEIFQLNFRRELLDNALSHLHKARNPEKGS